MQIFQAESAIKREEKRNKSFKPPKEDVVKREESGSASKKAKSDLDLDALKAKVKAASVKKKKKEAKNQESEIV